MTFQQLGNRNWATRPVDEWYFNLDDLAAAVKRRRDESFATTLPVESVRASVSPDGDVLMAGSRMTNWAWNQVASRIKAPAEYLATLPSELVVECVNHGLDKRGWLDGTEARDENRLQLLATGAGQDVTLRAVTTPRYSRVWDSDVVTWAQNLNEASGGAWTNPMAYARHEEHKPLANAEGMVPAGLYASDRDVFLFLVNDVQKVAVGNELLGRGVFISNSEVGAQAFRMDLFLYRYVCGNNLVWGPHEIASVRRVHLGLQVEFKARKDLERAIKAYSDSDTSAERLMIGRAQAMKVAKNDEEAVAWLRTRKFAASEAQGAVRYAVQEEQGAGSLWQVVQGLTRFAQTIRHTDRRTDLETRAGRLLELTN